MANRLSPFGMVCFALVLGACTGVMSPPAGPERHESRSIEPDKAEQVRAELKMSSGELDVRGGAQKLLEADFT